MLSGITKKGDFFVEGEYYGAMQWQGTSLEGAATPSLRPVLLKLNENDDIWHKMNTSPGTNRMHGGYTDSHGNYYQLGSGEGLVFDGTIMQPDHTNLFLTKYSPEGDRLWIQFITCGDIMLLYVDGQDNIWLHTPRYSPQYFIASQLIYNGQAIDLERDRISILQINPVNGALMNSQKYPVAYFYTRDEEDNLYTNRGFEEGTVQKISPIGEVLWQKSFENQQCIIQKIKADSLGNLYIFGRFCGTISIGGLSVMEECSPAQAHVGGFMAKLDKHGNALWLKSLGQYFMSPIIGFDLHPDGGVFISGLNKQNTSILEVATEPGIYVIRLDAEGTVKWFRTFQGDFPIYPIQVFAYQDGVLISSSINNRSGNHTIDFDGHIVTFTTASSKALFFTYLDEKCTPKPLIEIPHAVCSNNAEHAPLVAKGEQIRWYQDTNKSILLYEGNEYTAAFTETTTLYVTQTIDGCESLATIATIRVNPQPNPPQVPNLYICKEGQLPEFAASGQSIVWYADAGLTEQVGQGNVFTPALPGPDLYYATQTVNGCQSEPARAQLFHVSPPSPPVVSNAIVCQGKMQAPLIAQGDGIRWYTDAALTNRVGEGNQYYVTNIVPGALYVVQVVNGCESTATLAEVKQGSTDAGKIQIPNVITPNGDSFNDEFRMPDISEESCAGTFTYLKVYNRWGTLVYYSNNAEFAWDARGHSTGMYFYVISFTEATFKGGLSVLR